MIRPLVVATVVLAACLSGVALGQPKLSREQQVRKDKRDFAKNDAWFYDDLDTAIDEAAKTKRPLMIVFR